jgi:hypothetical protein
MDDTTTQGFHRECLSHLTGEKHLATDDRTRFASQNIPSSEQIDGFFREGSRIIEGITTHFILMMDKIGHQEWADGKEITCA